MKEIMGTIMGNIMNITMIMVITAKRDVALN
jgi:hypothetical protein